MRVLNVAEITAYIKDLLQSDPILSDLWVRGEVSNFVRSAAGHMYFTLKAENTQLKCVLFRGNARGLSFVPVNGDAVIVHGNVSLYEASGQYQLYVDLVQPEGTGILQLQFEELRQRLEREGLFDPSRKRPLPAYPRGIGVVTSASGAVWHDIQTVLQRRYPLCELILSPSLVQGADAPVALVNALRRLEDDGRAELIVVARGGGSMEDLWCFNDERVARAIFAASVPVVSAVGHETDYTISDFVADLRAPTPSAAAEMIAPNLRDLEYIVLDIHDRMASLVTAQIEQERRRLRDQSHRIEMRSPVGAIQRSRQQLDTVSAHVEARLQQRIATAREQTQARARQLALLHPQQIMERGYAMVLDRSTGERLQSITDLQVGQELLVRLHDGAADVRVEAKHAGKDGPANERG